MKHPKNGVLYILEDVNGFEANNPFHTKGLSFITQVIILKYCILKHILQSIFRACYCCQTIHYIDNIFL